MNYTTNLNLKLPAYTDPVDIADINDNFTTIDGKLNKIVMTDVAISSWSANSASGSYADYYAAGYLYYASVTVTGCTANHTGSAIFDVASASSGDLAPTFATGAGSTTVFSKKDKGNIVTIKRLELWT